MAIRAVGVRRTLSLVKAFSTSTSLSSVFTGAYSSGLTSARVSSEHLFGHSQLSGFGRPCPPSRHILARCRSWTELRDCKHWLITLDFPKDPKPTREEMIDTYVKTLAAVLGSVEEAKKKIYALSTTTYTGFQCNIDEATSERLKEQPLVNWVLPDGYGDPEVGIFGEVPGLRGNYSTKIAQDWQLAFPFFETCYLGGTGHLDSLLLRHAIRVGQAKPGHLASSFGVAGQTTLRMEPHSGDRYDNGVITPDPNPPRPYNERPRQRNYDRQRDFRATDNMQGERRDFRPRPMEGGGNYRPVEGQQNNRSMEGRDNYRPMEGRDPMHGERRDYRPSYERRGPMQAERMPPPPIDRRDSFQQDQRGAAYGGPREATGGEGR